MPVRVRRCSLAPCEEIADGPGIGPPRVGVADGGGEEFDEAVARLVAGIGDDRGHEKQFAGLAGGDGDAVWSGQHEFGLQGRVLHDGCMPPCGW